jgi:hypothetical protein
MVKIIICMMNLINYPEVRSVASWLMARSCRMRSELNERCLMLIACLKLFSEYGARRNCTETDFSHA